MSIATILTAAVVCYAPETIGSVGTRLITLVEAGKLPPMAETNAVEKPVAATKSSEVADGADSALGKHVEVRDAGDNGIGSRGSQLQAYRS
jgi:hypothetical protein